MSKLFIFGGDSQIGKKILSIGLWHSPFDIAASTRNKPEGPSSFHYDLMQSKKLPRIECGDAAIICFGMTNIRACQKDPDIAWQINVEKTLELIARLSDKDVYISYLSSSSVFEGRVLPCHRQSRRTPRSVYAKTKTAVENFLFSEIRNNFSVIRLPKVVGESWPIYKIWADEYRNNGIVKPFSDRFLSPLNIEYAASRILWILSAKKEGVFHIRGSQRISYADYCIMNAKLLGIEANKIIPIKDKDRQRKSFSTPNLL